MTRIRSIIIGNSINSKVFSLGKEVYLVGGYLRDIILGKKSKDIDYIVRGDVKTFVNSVFGAIGLRRGAGTIVELKKEQMIRIVLKDGATLDFTRLAGDIKDNLGERDFTMNALAWSPETGLIDTFNGIDDIRKNIIRAVSIENFKNDPLRLLRVYRFASELGWNVERKTRAMVKQLNREIKRSAPERITSELFNLLNSKAVQSALKAAQRDGLLECLISAPRKKLSGNIRSISMLESKLKKLPKNFKTTLNNPFSQGITIKGLLRLEPLLEGSALNENALRLSRDIRERVDAAHRLLSAFRKNRFLNRGALFDTFAKAKEAAFDFLVLSGNARFLNRFAEFQKIRKKSLLTSEEIMLITGLKGGIALGDMIYKLKKMQFEGKFKTKKEAVRWLKNSLR